MLKIKAECAWMATFEHLNDCKTPEDVAISYSIAIKAIEEYEKLLDEMEYVDNSQKLETITLNDCPGYQYLLDNENK